MIRRPGAIVWLFAATIIAGALIITFYTTRLSLELSSEQENFKRSSISALVQNATLKELSRFEDLLHATAIEFDPEIAMLEILVKVQWVSQIDHFLYSETSLELGKKQSLKSFSGVELELDRVTEAILFESSNKLRSRLIYIDPLNPINSGSVKTAGLSLTKVSANHHFVMYLDIEALLAKITRDLEPFAGVTIASKNPAGSMEDAWEIELPKLGTTVSINDQTKLAPVLAGGAKPEPNHGNLIAFIALNISLWAAVALMLREHYYRLKAQKDTFEINAKAEKNSNLAILGELATSIAHEINQPLAVMQMRISMLLDEIKSKPSKVGLSGELRVVEDQLHRCSKIVKSIQSLNSNSKLRTEKIKLDDFFRDIRAILDLQTEQYNGQLDLSCPNDLYVQFNKTALEQIALNLSRNGFEAMRHLPKTKRILTIRAKACERSRKSPTVIEFIDRGKGLTKANRKRVFDAFYSTKNTGTGLGLSLSKTLAERNNAHISVESEEGVGSCFQVKIDAGKKPTHGNLATHEGQA